MHVGRIDYLSPKGTVVDSINYASAEEMLKDVKEDNFYGVPMRIVVYETDQGPLIPISEFSDMDPAPCVFITEKREP